MKQEVSRVCSGIFMPKPLEKQHSWGGIFWWKRKLWLPWRVPTIYTLQEWPRSSWSIVGALCHESAWFTGAHMTWPPQEGWSKAESQILALGFSVASAPTTWHRAWHMAINKYLSNCWHKDIFWMITSDFCQLMKFKKKIKNFHTEFKRKPHSIIFLWRSSLLLRSYISYWDFCKYFHVSSCVYFRLGKYLVKD